MYGRNDEDGLEIFVRFPGAREGVPIRVKIEPT